MRAFRCSRTNLLFPEDYVEEWGRIYGIGLGPIPISEALVNDYHRRVVEDGDEPMHPVSVCRAQVDLVDVSDAEFDERAAILAIDDPKMNLRAPIMRKRQILKSQKLRQLRPDLAAVADLEREKHSAQLVLQHEID